MIFYNTTELINFEKITLKIIGVYNTFIVITVSFMRGLPFRLKSEHKQINSKTQALPHKLTEQTTLRCQSQHKQ